MEIISQENTSADYALLTLSTANAINCEYFTQYPELKIQRLSSTSTTDLAKDSILGYALCIYKSPVWVVDTIRGRTRANIQAIKAYVTTDLNSNYSKSVNADGGENDED